MESAIAAVFATTRPKQPINVQRRDGWETAYGNKRSQWRHDVDAITDLLDLHNVRFDRNKFIEGCYE